MSESCFNNVKHTHQSGLVSTGPIRILYIYICVCGHYCDCVEVFVVPLNLIEKALAS